MKRLLKLMLCLCMSAVLIGCSGQRRTRIAYTVYPQAGPEEVDRLVTQELEQVGAPIEGLDSISSQSLENVSYIQTFSRQ